MAAAASLCLPPAAVSKAVATAAVKGFRALGTAPVAPTEASVDRMAPREAVANQQSRLPAAAAEGRLAYGAQQIQQDLQTLQTTLRLP